MNPLTDSSDTLEDAHLLRKRFDEEGYLFVRQLLPSEEVVRLRADFLEALDEAGWIDDVDDAIPSSLAQREVPGAPQEFFEGYIRLQKVQRFHEIAHHPRLLHLAGSVIQDDVLVHPRKIARAALPKDFAFMTAPHQDYRLIQGTGDCLTLWFSVGDCPDELGGLAILSGSHRRGLLVAEEAPGVGGLRVDVPFDVDDPSLDWCASAMKAGDILIFHSLTVHAARPNYTDSLRLSVDFRYQSMREPVVAGALAPHGAPFVPPYDELTAGWTETFSVEVPSGLTVAEPFDVFDPDIATPPSRILSSVGV